MPYKRIGKKIYHKKHGKWSVKQTATTLANARKTIQFLRRIEEQGR